MTEEVWVGLFYKRASAPREQNAPKCEPSRTGHFNFSLLDFFSEYDARLSESCRFAIAEEAEEIPKSHTMAPETRKEMIGRGEVKFRGGGTT